MIATRSKSDADQLAMVGAWIGVVLVAATVTGCGAGPVTTPRRSVPSSDATSSTESVAATVTQISATTSPDSASDAATDPGDLYAYEVGTGTITRLTDDPRIDGAPAWMPDGERLLFGRLVSGSDPRTGNSEILLINSDGSNEHQLTDHPAADITARPSPDGRFAVFSSERDGNPEIYLLDIASGELIRLTDDPAADLFPAISPDGRTIVFTSDRTGDDELHAMGIDGADPHQLTNTPGTDWLPEFSHDGTTIAFATEHSIDLINSDGTNRRTLAENVGNHPSWSPDGTQIAAVTGTDHGDLAICIVDVPAGTITVLTDDDYDDFYPAWSPDGEHIVYTRSPHPD